MSEDPQAVPGAPAPASIPPVKPLRIWPAIVLLLAMAGLWLASKSAGPDQQNIAFMAFMGRLAACLFLVVWWLAASRATAKERLAGFAGLLLLGGLTHLLLHPSMGLAGMMLVSVPTSLAAFGLAAVACGRMRTARRTSYILLIAACAFGSTLLLRNEGMWSDGALALHWRWSPSAEEVQLASGALGAQADDAQPLDASSAAQLASPEWPAFRGPKRDSRQYGTTLATDWEANPPEEQWRIPVGPAWSSFVVAGDLLFTQEQRGGQEAVTCYSAKTGQLHWITEVTSRFSDPLGGPGPRATPTLHDGGLYVMGAEGLLSRLEPLTGAIVWQADLREVAGRQPPTWGFASSPLVSDGTVVVHAGGEGDQGVLAFDAGTGELRWAAPSGNHTYSSPQFGKVAGQPVVLMLTNTGMNVLDPATGAERLRYEWPHRDYRALQPQPLADGDLLLPTGVGTGTRRIGIAGTGDTWAVQERWTASNLRPDFNDCVLHDGYLYGFDGGRFVCFSAETGERQWRGGNYGKGQVLLLADGGQLLVTSEKGDVILVEANPEAPVELGRITAFGGKTWNHPVVVGDRLFVRNAEEAACYRMPLG